MTLETLEARVVFDVGSSTWMSTATFNQFTGNDPKVSGYGYRDTSVYNPNEKISTSSTRQTIANTGSLTWTVAANLPFDPKDNADFDAGNGNTISSTVTTYNKKTGTLVVAVYASTGAGTFSSWDVMTRTNIPWGPEFKGVEYGYDEPKSFSAGGITRVGGGSFLGISIPETFYGAEFSGTVKARIGIEYGYYINGGTASLLHQGTFSYDAQPPTVSGGPTTITTSNVVQQGALNTQSPTIAFYANLKIEFHLNLHFGVALFGKTEKDVPIDVDQSLPLFSINAQAKDDNGVLKLNADGTPVLDGGILLASKDALKKEIGLPDPLKVIEKAKKDMAQADADEEEGRVARSVAKTDKELIAAEEKITNAQKKRTDAEKKFDDANKHVSGEKIGLGITYSFGETEGPLLGLTLGIGLGAASGKVSANLALGSISLTLPNVALATKTMDKNGKLVASTNSFKEGSKEDMARKVFSVSVNPLALLGQGSYTVQVGKASIAVTTVSLDLISTVYVDQTITAIPDVQTPNPGLGSTRGPIVTFAFTDEISGAPVIVTPTVAGVTLAPATFVSFVPSQTLQLQPAPGQGKIKVTPTLQEDYVLSNKFGISASLTAELKALAASFFGLSFGPLIDEDFSIVRTGTVSIKNLDYEVKPPAQALKPFTFGKPSADLVLSFASMPPAVIDVTNANPNPPIDYTLTITNNGPGVASSISIEGQLPPQAVLDPGRSTAVVSVIDGRLFVSLGGVVLGPGQSITVTVASNYASGPAGTITSFFQVIANVSDPVLSNNRLEAKSTLLTPLVFHVANEAELRAAVATVNTANPTDVPVVFLDADIHLSQGEVVISKSIVITSLISGGGFITADNASRLFFLGGPGAQTYKFVSLRITGGNGVGQNEGFGGAIQLIDADDTLFIEDSVLANNTALTGEGRGGAIYVSGISGGNAKLILTGGYGGTLFDNNRANEGGAIMLRNSTTTILGGYPGVTGGDLRVQFTNNSATIRGGAIAVEPRNGGTASLTIDQALFENNQAPLGASINSNVASGQSATVKYSLSAFATSSPANFSSADGATFLSLGNNIASDGTGNLTADGDRRFTRPGLSLSSLIIASGVMGDEIGSFSFAWPGVDDSIPLQFSIAFPADVYQVRNGVLSLRPDKSFLYDGPNTFQTISVLILNTDNNQNVGRNTNFRLQVLNVPKAPTGIKVTSSNGINENTSTSQQPGVVIGTVTLENPSPDDEFTFFVDDTRFQVVGNATSGYQLFLRPGLSLKFLDAATIPIQITATNTFGLSVTSPFTVVVNRVDQAPTKITLSNTFVQPGQPGVDVGIVKTIDPNVAPGAIDAPGAYTYIVSDGRFEVVNSVLRVRAGQALTDMATPIPLTITATDASNLSVTQTLALSTKPPVSIEVPTFPTVTSTNDPVLVVGMPVSLPFNATGGNDGPYTFSVTRGSLPANLTLSASGLLTGTPTAIGDFEFDVTAADAKGIAGTTTVRGTIFTTAPQSNTGSAIQLSAATYAATEGQGPVSVTLTRTGMLATAATVTYTISTPTSVKLKNQATLSGNAADISGALTGTVSFAPGEMQKTITIGLTADNLVEVTESFFITISAPTGGAGLGTQTTATVGIADVNLPPVPNQAASEAFKVRLKLAGDGFGKSPEHYRDFITKAYAQFLGRAPDENGFKYWVGLMQLYETSNHQQGLRQGDIEAGFIASPEYVGRYGGTSGEQWVRGIYKDLLNRAADQPGVDFFLAQLRAGVTPTAAAQLFTNSLERLTNRVNDSYRTYLGRESDAAGLAYWIAIFQQGGTTEDINSGFVGSPEYYNKQDSAAGNPNKWIRDAYLDILFRPARVDEIDYWANFLKG